MYHVNSFIYDNIFDLAHLNESSDLTTWGVCGGHLDAQGAYDKQGLVVHLHKVDVEHHASQSDEDSTRENCCVLQRKDKCYNILKETGYSDLIYMYTAPFFLLHTSMAFKLGCTIILFG